MVIDFEGKSYSLDLDDVDLNEARIIFQRTGLTLVALQDALTEAHPEALAALYWLMQKQNGKVYDMDRLNFKIVKFGNAVMEAVEREREREEEEADPTPKAKAGAKAEQTTE